MIQKYRQQFNDQYSKEKYQLTQDKIKDIAGIEVGFRLSESPIFLSKDFKDKLDDACETIVAQIKKI